MGKHSSARLERFLQAAAEDNMQVAHCATAAQHFHILRRQMLRGLKPLVMMTPKSHLRSKPASSPFSEFVEGEFHEVLNDGEIKTKSANRLVLCSGKVAHDLRAKRSAENIEKVIVTIEQLYPFPAEQLKKVLGTFKKSVEVIWCQEEPQNMGPWTFIRPYLESVGLKPTYVGRHEAASTAPGSAKRWKSSQELLVDQALGLKPLTEE